MKFPVIHALCILVLMLFSASRLRAEDMTKVVFRDTLPETKAGSFAAKPKTLYRSGTMKGRLLEEPDPALKLQLLLICNEKDAWMINLMNKTGKHLIDPGPSYGFHIAIVPPEGGDPRAKAKDFEIGKELEFMKNRNVEPKEAAFKDKPALLYECKEDGLTLRTYVSPETKVPVATSVYNGDKLLAQLEYDEYVPSLPLDETLFSEPMGFEITEQKVEKPKPESESK